MTTIYFISRSYCNTDFSWPLSLNNKIIIFLDRVYGWQLDIADQCLNGVKDENGLIVGPLIQHSGHAVLHILFSYFEMIAKYHEGYNADGKSKYHFKLGVNLVFPQLKTQREELVDELLNVLYENVRCGLYHAGNTGSRIAITSQSGTNVPIMIRGKLLIINPYYLVPMV